MFQRSSLRFKTESDVPSSSISTTIVVPVVVSSVPTPNPKSEEIFATSPSVKSAVSPTTVTSFPSSDVTTVVPSVYLV